jgi:Fur family ferric uptake transcriptional regulator
MTSRLENILKVNRLSVTDNRKTILELFLNSPGALSHNDIEKKVGQKFDRVTIYRTLHTFLEKGIVHNIPTPDNSMHYALCGDNCSAGDHRDNDIHFVCNVCSNTICLEEVGVPDIRLPKGFTPERIEMLVSGVCKNCQ